VDSLVEEEFKQKMLTFQTANPRVWSVLVDDKGNMEGLKIKSRKRNRNGMVILRGRTTRQVEKKNKYTVQLGIKPLPIGFMQSGGSRISEKV
jgi:hypothetical protein